MPVRMMTKKIEGSFPEDSYPCDSCKHDPEPWDSEACDGCCKAHSGYEPKDSPTESPTVSLGVFEQVKWERDVAIQQLEELGYGLGEKIRRDEDCISRSSIKQKLKEHHDFFIKAYGGFSNLPQNDKSRVDEISDCIAMVVNEPSVKPKADVDALITKIEIEMSWYMFDEWGNTTDIHDQLVGIIREIFGEVNE